MLSAEKTKSITDLVKFINGKAAVITWKLDGLTLVLRHENGRLKQAITRGAEGRIGEDVTHTAKIFMNIPVEIPCREPFEVRGEGVISWDNFDKLNQETDDEPYSHPRGLAAGAVRRLDASKSKNQFLEFFAFELVSDNEDLKTKVAQYETLISYGFDVVPYVLLPSFIDKNHIEERINTFDPKQYGYPVDGCIVEYKVSIMKNFKFPLYVVSKGHGQKEIKINLKPNPLAETETNGQIYCDKINNKKELENWLKEYHSEDSAHYPQLIKQLLSGNTIIRIAKIYSK